MKSVKQPAGTVIERLHLTDEEHPIWAQAFSADTRCGQIEEDLFAARTVGGVLLTIVCVGAIVGALSVMIAIAVW